MSTDSSILNSRSGRNSSPRARLAPYLCGGMVVATHLAFYTMFVPMVRTIELSVCREYYQMHDPTAIDRGGYVEESRCKVNSIQRKLAWLMTLNQLLSYGGDFLATLPLSLLADNIGPRPVLILNFSGQILSWLTILCVCFFYNTFRSEMVLISALFTAIGGATHLSSALVWGEAAYFSENQTATFSVYEALEHVSQLIGPILGSSLMTYRLSAPFYFAIPLALTSIPLAWLLPSGPRTASQTEIKNPLFTSRKYHSSESATPSEQELLLMPDIEDSEGSASIKADSQSTHALVSNDTISYLRSSLKDFQRQVRKFGEIFFRYQTVKFAWVAQLISKLGKQVFHLLPQYLSKRFGISIAQAGYLFAIKAVVIIILYSVVLPFGQRVMSAEYDLVNIRLARISVTLLVAGTAMMALSWNVFALIPGLIVFALGSGFPVLVRSIATSSANVNKFSIPLLYGGLAYAETFGSFIGATAVTAAFTGTLNFSGAAAGVPFLVSTLAYSLVAIPTWLMDFSKDLSTAD